MKGLNQFFCDLSRVIVLHSSVKPSRLGAVAAIFHIAPAPALVAAGINEQPAAGRISACFNPF
jgi:hypothetical protein